MPTLSPELTTRELASRSVDGLTITLWWVQNTLHTYVTVEGVEEAQYRIDVPDGIPPNDIFMHPFVYLPDQLKAPKDKTDTGREDGKGKE